MLEGAGYDVENTVLNEPYWLQDDTDGTCLGPSGFSECGDATLWKIRRRPAQYPSTGSSKSRRSRRRRRKAKTSATLKDADGDGDTDASGDDKSVTWFSILFQWEDVDADADSNSDSNSETNDPEQTQSSSSGGEWEYALELADVNLSSGSLQEEKAECIISMPSTSTSSSQQEKSENENNNEEQSTLQMGSCESDDAWSWSINEGGVLTWERNWSSLRTERRNEFGAGMILGGPLTRLLDVAYAASGDGSGPLSTSSRSTSGSALGSAEGSGAGLVEGRNGREEKCLWKTGEANAITASCQPNAPSSSNGKSLVSFSVIQYQNSAAVSPRLPRFPRQLEDGQEEEDEDQSSSKMDKDGRAKDNSSGATPSSTPHSHLPTMKRSSQTHAAIHDPGTTTSGSSGSMKSSTPGLHLHPGLASSSSSKKEPTGTTTTTPLNSANIEIKSPLGVGGAFERTTLKATKMKTSGSDKKKILHHPPRASPIASPTAMDDLVVHKPKKIPVHPYIAASKDGYYMDEVTGMEYPTDISEYLGHDRKEVGRHTLTGVGVYTRTMLKIKVYGVAFYVAKRDVLADPGFSDFAGMTAEELHQSDAFYQHLMTMGSNPLEGASFDRSLFIKLNMQLATETVRRSLTAEWQLLTEEHKELLSASSSKAREADERMLKTIQNEENTSNCSCGSTAPPEFEADPSCCARGTEMVFTWLKDGSMQLRIDGRVMDTFPYPEIGKGIFYEYLRGDDPMSAEARERFCDGFPFLLAPLDQLKGFVSKQDNPSEQTTGSSSSPKGKKTERSLQKMFGEAIDHVNTRAGDAISWVQGNVHGGISNVNSAIRHVGSATQNLGSNLHNAASEFDKRRDFVWHQLIRAQHHSTRAILSRLPFLNKNLAPLDTTDLVMKTEDIEIRSNQTRRNIFMPQIAKMLGDSNKQRPVSDEIGVIIEPTMNFTHMMFLYLVHFYLVLLLIVSVPDSVTTRLVIKRSSDSTLDSETDHEERCKDLNVDFSCKDGVGPWGEVPDAIPRFVVKKDGADPGSVGTLLEDSDDNDEVTESRRQKQPMKKSLSYFL